jgi:hypothetical protein
MTLPPHEPRANGSCRNEDEEHIRSERRIANGLLYEEPERGTPLGT